MDRIGNPEADYENALAVTIQWFETYSITQDKRALDTAMACSCIARERYAVVHAVRQAQRGFRRLAEAQERAERASTVAEMRRSLAECRMALFEARQPDLSELVTD